MQADHRCDVNGTGSGPRGCGGRGRGAWAGVGPGVWMSTGLALMLMLAWPARAEVAPSEWDAMSLAALAGHLEEVGETVVAEDALHAALVQHLEARLAAGGGQSELAAWREVVTAVGRSLPADLQAAIAGHLESVTVPEGALLAGLEADELWHTANSLAALEHRPRAGAMAVQWVLEGAELSDLALVQLRRVAWMLSMAEQEPASEAHQKLVAAIELAYMQDPAVLGQTELEHWHRILSFAGQGLDAARRTLWAERLAAAFAADAAQVDVLLADEQQLGAFVRLLSRLGGEVPSTLVSRLAEPGGGDEAWLQRIRQVRNNLDHDGRSRLVAVLQEQVLADAAAARAVGVSGWQQLRALFGRQLREAELGEQWRGYLEAAFAPGTPQLQGLPMRDALLLRELMRSLGDEQADALLLTWAADRGDWSSADAGMLHDAIHIAARLGEGGHGLRLGAISAFEADHLPDRAAMRDLGLEAVARVVRRSSHLLDESQMVTWSGHLRDAFAADVSDMAELEGFSSLAQALHRLGDGQLPALAAAWFDGSGHWRDRPLSAYPFYGRLLAEAGQAGEQARAALAAHILDEHMGAPEQVRQVNAVTWKYLARAMGQTLPAELRVRWTERLKGAFTEPQHLAGLPANEVRDLAEALRRLQGSETAAAALIPLWFEAHKHQMPETVAGSPRDVGTVALWAFEAGVRLEHEELVGFEAAWLEAFEAGALEVMEVANIVWVWIHAGDGDRAGAWAMRAFERGFATEQARQQADAGIVLEVTLLLAHTRGYGEGHGYEQLAAVMARLAGEGRLGASVYFAPRLKGMAVGTEASRQVLAQALVDSAGLPRLDVAAVLGWAALHGQRLDAWREQLEHHLQQAEGEDAAAMWLLAGAEAAAIAPRDQPTPAQRARQLRSIREAVGRADSEAVRLRAVQALADYYVEIGRPGQGAAALASMRMQFGEQAASELDALSRSLERLAAHQRAEAEHRQQQAERARLESDLRRHRHQLERAEAMGQPQRAQRHRQAIERIEAALAE